ncbi:MAG: hypothetical protein KatS3mg111_3996 [Pirellulaceae bacterium]|nr:MAG: hypothetical protein KatS3mg111_0455 [Pirellulaceae bacterium]GIX00664.1 MAG: hypothetical protein KatS3mg111_3996 [Pirellulaceae bacterium]
MKERLLSMLATAGLVIAVVVVVLPSSRVMAMPGHTCSPSATAPCVVSGTTCESGSLQTGKCVPSVTGKACSSCLQRASGGCKCEAM